MMSSAKARPENAEVERRVKRRLHRLHGSAARRDPWCHPSSRSSSYTAGTTLTCPNPRALTLPAPTPLPENLQEYVGELARHGHHRIMAGVQFAVLPARLRTDTLYRRR